MHAVSVGGDMQADKNGSVLSEDKMWVIIRNWDAVYKNVKVSVQLVIV